MPEHQPSGTVTFLFTDIEDSTRLWERDASAMSVALQRHDAIVRATVAAHDGLIFATGGDGFAVVFGRAADAIRAAAAAQRALDAEAWPVPLRVRMGVHTGEAEERDGDYFGPAVNRVARIMSEARGGQVLVSLAAAEVVRDQLGADLALIELGERALRALSRPERVCELTWTAPAPPTTLEVRVLGPLQLIVDGVEVEVRGPKRRAVLALLALASPRTVSVDGLCAALWPDDDRGSGGRVALQSHLSRLRRHLGPVADRLDSDATGYRLELGGEELDARRAAELVERGRAKTAIDASAAQQLASAAGSLWRGRALEEFPDVAPLASWARTLDELRLNAADLQAEAAIEASDWADAASASAAAIELDPLRESSVLFHMRALAGARRAVDALRVGHAYRQRLADQTGLHASPALAVLEQAIAAGDEPGPSVGVPSARRSVEPGTTLFGRDAEIAGLVRLLRSERLVTLVGPGGVGKTTVAMEVARRDRSGRELTTVALAPVTDPSSVLAALTSAVGLRGGTGDPLTAVAEVLASRPWLVVLDNCEHLLGAVRAIVGTLVSACEDLTILATSRERLGLPFEQISRLAPLPLPPADQLDDLAMVPSVALFVERAHRVRPDLEFDDDQIAAVAAMVRRLDGVPLAIELAAGRLSSLGLPDLARRLDRALDVLAGSSTAGERHATLRAAVEWSYDLLPEEERRVFRSLAIFPDGFDLETAEGLTLEMAPVLDPTAAVSHLVDASMLVVSFGERPRYRMLDTLRAFGLDRLTAAREYDDAVERLFAWAQRLAATINARVFTEDEPAIAATLVAEGGNLRFAWITARARDRMDVAVSLVESLWAAAWWRELPEVLGWAADVIADPKLIDDPSAAIVFAAAAEHANQRGLIEEARALSERGLAVATAGSAGERFCLMELGNAQLFRGQFADARANILPLTREPRFEAMAWSMCALCAAYAGQLADARELNERDAPPAPSMAAMRLYVAGEIENLSGFFEAAERCYREAQAIAATVGATFIEGVASVGLVAVQAAAGKFRDALLGYRALIDYWQRTGGWTQQWTTLRNAADLFDQLGDDERAAALRAAADDAPEASTLGNLTTASIASGNPAPEHNTAPAPTARTRDQILELAHEGLDHWLQRLESSAPVAP